ncbi:MAG: Crp/Fnr family transcriptional regulator [Candidatus Treponema excrementipullorum]|nr:Crp/Fnr family transcriptional regulator [Spirochaetia bacterium]MDD7011277.1 Crp/Fnr family transcriptional regulator [Candidatus Treponema excrementipullorum]MCI6953402.1 Crp/Fnr family transcriptional regulator [Spirochaetia bacterium]MCI7588368.1 Crp/Fnr family transcriptional regulator [Spirochaetia bacterium]MDY2755515.1 Crp/Fnr family transcriptional regulator [Candidatus Treponema excrementipullorum]
MLQLSMVHFNKGSYIFIEGNPCTDRFYIIKTGFVSCSRSRPGAEPEGFGPGDFIGVISCMSGFNQPETAIAATDVQAIAVRRDQYSELIQNNTPVALKTIRSFANRMRTMNEKLTQLALSNVSVESPEQIFDVASYYDSVGDFDPAIFAYYQYLKVCPRGEHAEIAKKRFVVLKNASKAVYFEPTAETVRFYPKGTMVFSECQSGQDMFIIQDGQVKITKIVNGTEVILAVLKKGDFFGEMALLENKPRSASIIAFEDCYLMVVNRKNFDQMVASQPQLISRLTKTLAERLWTMERQLNNATLQDPVYKMIDMIALQLEKERFVPTRTKVAKHFDFTPQDLANMTGIPLINQRNVIEQFLRLDPVRVDEKGKVFVPDCADILKAAAFYRKQH